MIFSKVVPATSIALFVKDILVFEEKGDPEYTELLFFADGYPGLIFHSTPRGQWVGVSVKDFIPITKFQQSFEQLSTKDYEKLSDIVSN